MIHTITEETHLTDRADVDDFCQYICFNNHNYDAETLFSEDHTLSESKRAIMNRLVAEAKAILDKDGKTFEDVLNMAKGIYIHRIQQQMRRQRELQMRRHLRITRSGFF